VKGKGEVTFAAPHIDCREFRRGFADCVALSAASLVDTLNPRKRIFYLESTFFL